MTKEELIKETASRCGVSATKAKEFVDCIFDTMKESLAKGEPLIYRGFGTLCVKRTGTKTARNISEGTVMIIQPHNTVKFIISNELKKRING